MADPNTFFEWWRQLQNPTLLDRAKSYGSFRAIMLFESIQLECTRQGWNAAITVATRRLRASGGERTMTRNELAQWLEALAAAVPPTDVASDPPTAVEA